MSISVCKCALTPGDPAGEALNQLDPNQQKAVLKDEIKLYVHLPD